MKIATWNVNSIRVRKEQVAQWLKDNKIDVLCLQETKVIEKKFPREMFEELGYNVYVSGQKTYNGVAIFSTQPLDDVLIGFEPLVSEELRGDFDEQKRVISGVFNNIRIVNLYIPNGSSVDSEKYFYKLYWFRVLREYLTQLIQDETQEICICGDFNVALEDKDIYNPTGKDKYVMATDLERQALQDILDMGFFDAFRKFTTEGGHFSWWDYRHSGFPKNRGWRIDYCCLTEKLYKKATNCYIDINPRTWERPSDHTPVIVEF